MLNPTEALLLALDPTLILRAQGLTPDPWQREFLLSTDRQVALNCNRQAGKSTVTAALAIHTAIFQAPALILILSPGMRQSGELFRKIKEAYSAIGRPVGALAENQSMLELENGSRIVAMPGKEQTVRSFSKVKLLIIDEASRVSDDLYRAVRPMLAVSKGRLMLLSTPFGQRGFFFNEWIHGSESEWKKVKVTWEQCPRITAEYIESERLSMGDAWVQQEFECLFTALEGLVYPEFSKCLWDCLSVVEGKLVGGIDFGWRNPFAAIWGALDRDRDILSIVGERYLRQTPIEDHAAALKRVGKVRWYADPASPGDIESLRRSNLKVLKADNSIRLGIAAVTARIRTGRLRISRTGCPNLIEEASLYRYPSESERKVVGENPIDEHNHALGALRYLIAKIDAGFISRLKRLARADGPIEEEEMSIARASEPEPETVNPYQQGPVAYQPEDNDELWEIL